MPLYYKPRPSTTDPTTTINHAPLLQTTPLYYKPRPSTTDPTTTINHAPLLQTTPLYYKPRPSTTNHAPLLQTQQPCAMEDTPNCPIVTPF